MDFLQKDFARNDFFRYRLTCFNRSLMTVTTDVQRIASNDPTLTECDLQRSDLSNISELV